MMEEWELQGLYSVDKKWSTELDNYQLHLRQHQLPVHSQDRKNLWVELQGGDASEVCDGLHHCVLH